jgi:hypothetical protein
MTKTEKLNLIKTDLAKAESVLIKTGNQWEELNTIQNRFLEDCIEPYSIQDFDNTKRKALKNMILFGKV